MHKGNMIAIAGTFWSSGKVGATTAVINMRSGMAQPHEQTISETKPVGEYPRIQETIRCEQTNLLPRLPDSVSCSSPLAMKPSQFGSSMLP